jgi:hypothetical protein
MNRAPPSVDETVEKPVKTICLEYIPGHSENLRRHLNKFNVRTTFKSSFTLRSTLSYTKPFNPTQHSKNSVYSLPCDCGKTYFGESKRPLNIRANEHRQKVKTKQVLTSLLAKHYCSREDHNIMWEDMKIILKEPDHFKRRIKEAAVINIRSEAISQASYDLPAVWNPVITKEVARRCREAHHPHTIAQAGSPRLQSRANHA